MTSLWFCETPFAPRRPIRAVERAAIFVGPDSPTAQIAQCHATCEANGWAIADDRIMVLDPEHPDQGLPVVLFTSVSAPITILVVPSWDDLMQGLLDSVYHV